jgi:predicted PurR-regulated permease PerM
MTLLRMPNPILWGVLPAILNFIPYVGSATTLVVLAIVAFVSFDGVGQVLSVTGTYLALTTLEGQIIQPLFVGQRLELNPIIVFLALRIGSDVSRETFATGAELESPIPWRTVASTARQREV